MHNITGSEPVGVFTYEYTMTQKRLRHSHADLALLPSQLGMKCYTCEVELTWCPICKVYICKPCAMKKETQHA